MLLRLKNYSGLNHVFVLLVLLLSASGLAVYWFVFGRDPQMVTLWDVDAPAENTALLVFLPGIYDTAETVREEGIFRLARQAGLRADMVAVGTQLGYLFNHTLLQHLQEDVIRPARRRGYTGLWLVGFSLGGFSSLRYFRQAPGDVCGVIVIAPYLGRENLINSIEQAGGPLLWQPRDQQAVSDEEAVWLWLKHRYRKPLLQRLFLAYGEADDFARAHVMLGRLLPPANVISSPGDHSWNTWRRLWKTLLAKEGIWKGPGRCNALR